MHGSLVGRECFGVHVFILFSFLSSVVMNATLRNGYLFVCKCMQSRIVYSTHRHTKKRETALKNNTRLPFVDISSVAVVWIQSEKSEKKTHINERRRTHTAGRGKHACKLGCIVIIKWKPVKIVVIRTKNSYFRALQCVGWAMSALKISFHEWCSKLRKNSLFSPLSDTPYHKTDIHIWQSVEINEPTA